MNEEIAPEKTQFDHRCYYLSAHTMMTRVPVEYRGLSILLNYLRYVTRVGADVKS